MTKRGKFLIITGPSCALALAGLAFLFIYVMESVAYRNIVTGVPITWEVDFLASSPFASRRVKALINSEDANTVYYGCFAARKSRRKEYLPVLLENWRKWGKRTSKGIRYSRRLWLDMAVAIYEIDPEGKKVSQLCTPWEKQLLKTINDILWNDDLEDARKTALNYLDSDTRDSPQGAFELLFLYFVRRSILEPGEAEKYFKKNEPLLRSPAIKKEIREIINYRKGTQIPVPPGNSPE